MNLEVWLLLLPQQQMSEGSLTAVSWAIRLSCHGVAITLDKLSGQEMVKIVTTAKGPGLLSRYT